MTDTTSESVADAGYETTIDWDHYWTETDDAYRDDANGSWEFVADAFHEFLAEKGVPDAYADVGCGGGALAFDVAERYPETTVVGYDAAEPALDANRERAEDAGRENVSFEPTVLPEFDPEPQFDVVSSFYTLCYVPDVEPALRNLYDAVAPGGYLVFTYHNRLARAVFSGIAESPHEHLDESSPWDPDHFAERFRSVLSGDSLLSYDRIHDALGTWPRSVWSVAEETDRYAAWRQNPLVYVPK